MRTHSTEHYGCRYPFAGAGMAFVCETPVLAAAVCEAGGIGAITGFAQPDSLRTAIRELRRRTAAPFHVNLFGVLPMPWLAGQGAGLVHEVRPAGQVVERMMAEAGLALARLQAAAAPEEVGA